VEREDLFDDILEDLEDLEVEGVEADVNLIEESSSTRSMMGEMGAASVAIVD
jgi:hypothetical protein